MVLWNIRKNDCIVEATRILARFYDNISFALTIINKRFKNGYTFWKYLTEMYNRFDK